MIGALVMYGMFFFTSQYLQLTLGLSALEAGLWSLPPIAGLMISASAVAKLADRYRPGYLVAGGSALTSLGFIALVGLDPRADCGCWSRRSSSSTWALRRGPRWARA